MLTTELIQAGKELKNHPDIIVRKADKSNVPVVIDRTEYTQKLQNILNDQSKFKKLTRNPTQELKTRVNKLIYEANRCSSVKLLQPIVGEFKPGHIFGTVKLNKNGNPIRPLISQIPTPNYETAK